jgi:hypothetical protein
MECDTAVESKNVWLDHQCNAAVSRAGRGQTVIKMCTTAPGGAASATSNTASRTAPSTTAGGERKKKLVYKRKVGAGRKAAPPAGEASSDVAEEQLPAVQDTAARGENLGGTTPRKPVTKAAIRRAFFAKKPVAHPKKTAVKKKAIPKNGAAKDTSTTNAAPTETAPKDAGPKDAAPKDAAPTDTTSMVTASKDAAPKPRRRSSAELQCPDCPAERAPQPHTNRRTLAAHRLTHHLLSARPLNLQRPCLLCAATVDDLDAHTFDVHGAEGTMTCPVCYRWVRNEPELRAHLEKNHNVVLPNTPRSVQCRLCDRQCGDLDQLTAHQEDAHMGLVPFPRLELLITILEDIDITLIKPPPQS